MTDPLAQSAPRPGRPRRPRPAAAARRRRQSRLPVTIRYGLPLAATAALVIALVSWWVGSFTYLRVVDAQGAPVAAGLVEFFEFDDSRGAPSPPPKRGEVAFDAGASIAVGSDLVEGPTLVRLSAPGLGLGYGFVERGDEVQTCELGPAIDVEGRVLGPAGTGAGAARVAAFGGGAHGVLLAEVSADATGRFVLAGLSSAMAYVHCRVWSPGCVVSVVDHWFGGDKPLVVQLRATEPVVGRVIPAEGMTPDGLTVRALVRLEDGNFVHNVPGVEAVTDEVGDFRFDNLPPGPLKTRLILRGLPEGYTHRAMFVVAGDTDAVLHVHRAGSVRGRVIDPATGVGIAGAAVLHEHGPHAGEAVRCNGSGDFRIEYVPPGDVLLEVVSDSRSLRGGRERLVMRRGALRLEIEEGEARTGVAIELQPSPR